MQVVPTASEAAYPDQTAAYAYPDQAGYAAGYPDQAAYAAAYAAYPAAYAQYDPSQYAAQVTSTQGGESTGYSNIGEGP